MDGTVHSAFAEQRSVGRVHDCVHGLPSNPACDNHDPAAEEPLDDFVPLRNHVMANDVAHYRTSGLPNFFGSLAPAYGRQRHDWYIASRRQDDSHLTYGRDTFMQASD